MCTTEVTSSRFKAVKEVDELREEKKKDVEKKPEQVSLAFVPRTVGEFFFADENGNMPQELNFKEVDLIYNDYMRIMASMHEKLKLIYN